MNLENRCHVTFSLTYTVQIVGIHGAGLLVQELSQMKSQRDGETSYISCRVCSIFERRVSLVVRRHKRK